MQTRRKFIRDFAFFAAASAMVPAALANNLFSPPAFPTGPGYEQFLQQVNTPFILRTGAKSVKMILAEAKAIAACNGGAMDAGNEKFSLLFRGPNALSLEQGTYSFEHARLGSLSIFIVPVGGPSGMPDHFAAVFNRPANHASFVAQLAQAPRRSGKC
jgi:hypothetical protein